MKIVSYIIISHLVVWYTYYLKEIVSSILDLLFRKIEWSFVSEALCDKKMLSKFNKFYEMMIRPIILYRKLIKSSYIQKMKVGRWDDI